MTHFGVGEATLLLTLALAAAWYDQRRGRIPDWLAATGAALGVGLNYLLIGASGLLAAGLGVGIAVLVCAPLWRLGIIKSDDMKLMAAVGAIAGPHNWVEILFWALLVGVPLGVVLAFCTRKPEQTGVTKARVVRELLRFLPPYAKADELSLHAHGIFVLAHGALVAVGVLLFLVRTAITSRY